MNLTCPWDCNDVKTKVDSRGCSITTCVPRLCPTCGIGSLDGLCMCPQCLDEIVFQHRPTTDNDEFYRSWAEAKAGFRTPSGGFWLGLEKLHQLTKSGRWQLILTVQFKKDRQWARVALDNFEISSEEEGYRLNFSHVADQLGTRTDFFIFRRHNLMKFSASDKDNDRDETSDEAREYHGSWWFNLGFTWCLNCRNDIFNPIWYEGGFSSFDGGYEPEWRGLASTQMAARRRAH